MNKNIIVCSMAFLAVFCPLRDFSKNVRNLNDQARQYLAENNFPDPTENPQEWETIFQLLFTKHYNGTEHDSLFDVANVAAFFEQLHSKRIAVIPSFERSNGRAVPKLTNLKLIDPTSLVVGDPPKILNRLREYFPTIMSAHSYDEVTGRKLAVLSSRREMYPIAAWLPPDITQKTRGPLRISSLLGKTVEIFSLLDPQTRFRATLTPENILTIFLFINDSLKDAEQGEYIELFDTLRGLLDILPDEERDEEVASSSDEHQLDPAEEDIKPTLDVSHDISTTTTIGITNDPSQSDSSDDSPKKRRNSYPYSVSTNFLSLEESTVRMLPRSSSWH